ILLVFCDILLKLWRAKTRILMGKRLIYTLLLVAVTAVWGWTFVVVQDAISVYGVLPFLAVRFVLAGAALAPIYATRLTRRSLVVGGGIGVVLAAGYLFQTTGLLFTTPTNSGLITGLFVVFAPLADRLLFGARASRQVILAVVLSMVGMVLLAGGGPEGANWGDLLTLLCAAALGLHIALLSRYAASYDAGALTLAQIIAMALLFVVVWPFFDSVSLPPPAVWVALLVTGLLASAGAFLVQTTVQQKIPAARTAIILTMEPVFAALFGYWLAGDRLVAVQIFGAILILSALVIGEVVPVLRRGK
ncbi:MAG TPA: DMT family transporter, partial [Rubrobacter sp.]|nr:DMT family transporter [Rubrobacter sp.]